MNDFKNRKQSFLIRAMCSVAYGTGHLRRCITLANALRGKGYDVTVLTDKNKLAQSLGDKYPFVLFIDESICIPNEYATGNKQPDVLVLDLPQLSNQKDGLATQNLHRIINDYDRSGTSVVSLGHANHISHAFRAVIDLYPGKSIHAANYINGPEYVILRDEFQESFDYSLVNKKHHAVVTLGGSDPFNLTRAALEALLLIEMVEQITLVLGAGYDEERKFQIQTLLANTSKDVRILTDVKDMRSLIRQATFGVVGFGTTSFEFMSQGVPCFSFTHYLWQVPSAVLFDSLGCHTYLGCAEDGINEEVVKQTIESVSQDNGLLSRISASAMELVDGKGAGRIVELLIGFAEEKASAKLDVLYVLAHPGDEIFGCGGAILKEIQNGKSVGIVFLGEGVSARFDETTHIPGNGAMVKEIKSSVQRVMEKMGIKIWYNYQLSDNGFDKHDFLNIVKLVERLVQRHQPKTVFTHSETDLNIDHKITFNAVLTACRPISNQTVREIFSLEVPSSSDWGQQRPSFTPNWIVNIDETLEQKLLLAAMYSTEIREEPHPRSLEGLRQRAYHWGRLFGIKTAEVFYLHRHIS